ncbi:MAG: hypothetical protein O3C28_01580 [Proteobacteria bacterium]|nr:hypothetical protein [Pseudomonadota bacterium]
MSRMNNRVLLVGSIPGTNAADAMAVCGRDLSEYLDCVPDGETGTRRIWINFLAASTYHGHPLLETINRPTPIDLKHPDEWRTSSETWAPRGYSDHWQFRVKPGADSVRFENLGYANAAKQSYPDFCDLRDAGVLAKDARFMVAIPLIESAIRPFITNQDDFEIMWLAYAQALKREVMDLSDCIPSNDLVVQWDICMEVVAIDGQDQGKAIFPWEPSGDPHERFVESLTLAAACVPRNALMGLHLCYGDLGHRHIIEPRNLAIATGMANCAASVVKRDIDYIHMPVPRDRNDDAYFEPLRDLNVGDTKLYLGLIHTTGGEATSLGLLETAKRHAAGFGVATECGFGRRPAESMPELLRIHRLVADSL